MAILEKIREFATERTIQLLIEMAAKGAKKDPDGSLKKMLTICHKLTDDHLWSAVIDNLEHKIITGHPGIGVARKFLTQLNPKVRGLLIRNLFVRETLLGPKKRHALEEQLGYYPPSTIVISPSMSCTLRCYGCYAGNYPKDEQLSFEEVDSIINQAKELGIYFVVISGGEPFTWEPLLKIFETHRDVVFQVYTSGLFLDDEMVDRLADLGNVAPAISCEGFEEETDRRRGKGSYEKVNRAMLRLKNHGVMFSFSATVTRENMEIVTSDEFVDHWIEMGCLLGWYFTYMPIGRKPCLELMPTPEQRVELSRRTKEIRATKEIMVIDFWNDGEHSGGCIAGARKYFHINNKGDVEPCVFCHFATENIREKPIKEILASDFFNAIRARQPYNKDLRRVCIMIDNPQVLREVVKLTGAHGTHQGAETLITEFADELDKYAEEFGEALKDGPVSALSHTV